MSISLRLSQELWTRINHLVETGKCNNTSDAVRSLIEGGLWLHENKDSFQNEEAVRHIIEQHNSKMNEKGIFEWTSQLNDTQIEGIRMALDLEKERRRKSS